ncbi:50S ribosomal protein L24 [Christensenellaceae bacterium OttesenSCG-928-L17]|nr:50S ribosomal protein L24 [Christensenellaceae bacterium OttesenSCG-928-L17]
MKTSIKTGDTVKVITGDNKGKTAKVLKVSPSEKKAYLDGIGIRTRHMRPTQYQKGGKKDIHIGIHLSNLKLEKSAEIAPKTAAKKEAKK